MFHLHTSNVIQTWAVDRKAICTFSYHNFHEILINEMLPIFPSIISSLKYLSFFSASSCSRSQKIFKDSFEWKQREQHINVLEKINEKNKKKSRERNNVKLFQAFSANLKWDDQRENEIIK